MVKPVKRVFARFWRIKLAVIRKETMHSMCPREFIFLDAQTRINCKTLLADMKILEGSLLDEYTRVKLVEYLLWW